jgi:CxxC motif-containing protein
MNREIICIMCPLGCRIQVHIEGQEVQGVEGERCKKGAKYAQQEVTFPGRILTTTVTTDTPEMPLLPVRSNKAIPKESLIECMKHISKQSAKGPVKLGQTVIENILGLGVDIVACRTIPFATT